MAGPVLFSELDCLSPSVVTILNAQSFTRATPVQEAVIPLFCSHKDVAVDAATGSGKTLAFVLPIVERLRSSMPGLLDVLAMIVSPTRELAMQTHAVANPFFMGCAPGCNVVPLIGGTDVANDVAGIKNKGAAVLIGTPGRISDVLTRCTGLNFKTFEVLVLDEADRLLEMGFRTQIDSIMAKLPRQRRTGLFSATQTEAVQALVRAGLRNPFRVNVAVTATGGNSAATASNPAQKTPASLDISHMIVPTNHKIPTLLNILQSARKDGEKVIVYFLTCASVEYMSAVLPRLPGGEGLRMLALHGGQKQRKRNSIMQQFRELPEGVLVATDVAARGLDIPDVHCVLHFDAPQDPSNFVHRCGRTARMGRSGRAIALLTPHEDVFAELMKQRNVPMTQVPAPGGFGVLRTSTGTEKQKDDGSSGSDDDSEQRENEHEAPMVDTDMLAKAEARAAAVFAAARKISETEREVMERGTKAFVSYIRGYKEHHCKFVFQLADLSLEQMGYMFGLLRLPVMKEVRQSKKGQGMKAFKQSEVDPDSVPYLDGAREKVRKSELAKAKKAGKDRCTVREEKRLAREAAAATVAKKGLQKKLPAAKRQLHQHRDDLQDLEDDYKVYKKLKKGKISGKEYDIAMNIDE